MIKYKKEKIIKLIPISYICDKCKTEFSDPMDWQEFHLIKIDAGYNSAFGDGNKIECELCSTCLKEFIDSFYDYNKEEIK